MRTRRSALALATLAGLSVACALLLPVGSSRAEPPLARLPGLQDMQVPGILPRAVQRYMLHCMGCHGDGQGVPGKIPALRDSLGLYLRAPEGREFLMRVPGASNSPLSDQALAEVLNWMLMRFSANQLDASFLPYTGSELASHRRPALAEVVAHRRALVQRLARDGPAPALEY